MVFVGTCPVNKLPFVWKLNDRCRTYNTARDIFVSCGNVVITEKQLTCEYLLFRLRKKIQKIYEQKRNTKGKCKICNVHAFACVCTKLNAVQKKLLNQWSLLYVTLRFVTILNTIPKRTKRLWKVFIRQLIALIAPFARMDVSTTLRSWAPPLSDAIILNILSRHPCHGYDRLNEAAGEWSRRWFLELILATERSKPFPRLAVRGGNKWSCRRRSLSANSRGYIYSDLESW